MVGKDNGQLYHKCNELHNFDGWCKNNQKKMLPGYSKRSLSVVIYRECLICISKATLILIKRIIDYGVGKFDNKSRITNLYFTATYIHAHSRVIYRPH